MPVSAARWCLLVTLLRSINASTAHQYTTTLACGTEKGIYLKAAEQLMKRQRTVRNDFPAPRSSVGELMSARVCHESYICSCCSLQLFISLPLLPDPNAKMTTKWEAHVGEWTGN